MLHPRLLLFIAVLVVSLTGIQPAFGQYGNIIGYDDLMSELGGATPDGTGVAVHLVEVTPGNPHSNTVASNFYGGASIAMGITDIAVFRAVDLLDDDDMLVTPGWVDSAFLRPNDGITVFDPLTTTGRVANHSYVGGPSGSLFRRFDYVIDQDDFIQVVGLPNGGMSNNFQLWRAAYNEISVGVSNGNHRFGTLALDATYTAGRVAPTLVGPAGATSYSTPQVSASVAVLLETAFDGSLSNGTITNRTRTINHAETSEVIKAVLMAGADRVFDSPYDYIVDTSNNLSSRFGAGQVNIYDSYHILAAGEHDSFQDGNPDLVNNQGWDYDEHFGGLGGINDEASYFFTIAENMQVQASLVWNLDVEDSDLSPEFSPTDSLYNLDLLLIETGGGTTIADSIGSLHNTENLYLTNLVAGSYEFRIIKGVGQADFDFDYAFAWNVQPVPEPSSLLLLGIVSIGGSLLRLRKRKAMAECN